MEWLITFSDVFVHCFTSQQVEAMHLFRTVYSQPLVNAAYESRLDTAPVLTASAHRKKNPFSCNCSSLVPGSGPAVLFAQREFLYCACLATHHPLDPTGFSRATLLFLLGTKDAVRTSCSVSSYGDGETSSARWGAFCLKISEMM